MTYNHLALFLLGILGIVLHNLVELNKVNRAQAGNVNFKQYFKIEWISILISILVIVGTTFISQEIKQLEAVGKWLGAGFIGIGYMAQSLLIAAMGKAETVINTSIGQVKKEETPSNPT